MNPERFFEEKYLSLYEPLFRFIYQLCKDENAAEDLVQEVFLQAWKEKEKLSVHPNPDGWFYLTARNKTMNYLRLECRRDAYVLDDDEAGDALIPSVLSAEEEVFRRFFSYEELSAVLSAEEIALLKKRFSEAMGVKALAETAGVAEGAMKMRFSRIFAKLKKHPELFLGVWILLMCWKGGV